MAIAKQVQTRDSWRKQTALAARSGGEFLQRIFAPSTLPMWFGFPLLGIMAAYWTHQSFDKINQKMPLSVARPRPHSTPASPSASTVTMQFPPQLSAGMTFAPISVPDYTSKTISAAEATHAAVGMLGEYISAGGLKALEARLKKGHRRDKETVLQIAHALIDARDAVDPLGLSTGPTAKDNTVYKAAILATALTRLYADSATHVRNAEHALKAAKTRASRRWVLPELGSALHEFESLKRLTETLTQHEPIAGDILKELAHNKKHPSVTSPSVGNPSIARLVVDAIQSLLKRQALEAQERQRREGISAKKFLASHSEFSKIVPCIKEASAAIGENSDPAVTYAIIGQESDFRQDAVNPRSDATGLFQFMSSTWLEMIKNLPNSEAGQRILDTFPHIQIWVERIKVIKRRDGSAVYEVFDADGKRFAPAMRREISDGRKDGALNAALGDLLIRANIRGIAASLKMAPRDIPLPLLILANYVGAGSAIAIYRIYRENPETYVAGLFSELVVRNNPDLQGTAGSLWEKASQAVKQGKVAAQAAESLTPKLAGEQAFRKLILAGLSPS